MKTTKQLIFLLVTFLCVCIVSMPALSGEHPWDSDDDDGFDDDGSDSTMIIIPKYNDKNTLLTVSAPPPSDWFTNIINSISVSFTVWYLDLDSSDNSLQVESTQHKKVVKRDYKKTIR